MQFTTFMQAFYLLNSRCYHMDAPCRSVLCHAAEESNTSIMTSGLARPVAVRSDDRELPPNQPDRMSFEASQCHRGDPFDYP